MGSIKDQILSDMKKAMKSQEKEKVSVLRMLLSSIKNKEIQSRPKELTDQDTLMVLKKMSRQLKESIEHFQKGDRQDLVEKEKEELSIVSFYLPEEMGEGEIKKLVQESIRELGASSVKDMGSVMKSVLAKTNNNADNKKVSQIVKSLLQ